MDTNELKKCRIAPSDSCKFVFIRVQLLLLNDSLQRPDGAGAGDEDRRRGGDAAEIPGSLLPPYGQCHRRQKDGNLAGFDADVEAEQGGERFAGRQAGFAEDVGEAHAVNQPEADDQRPSPWAYAAAE